jgi:hypothetical protein
VTVVSLTISTDRNDTTTVHADMAAARAHLRAEFLGTFADAAEVLEGVPDEELLDSAVTRRWGVHLDEHDVTVPPPAAPDGSPLVALTVSVVLALLSAVGDAGSFHEDFAYRVAHHPEDGYTEEDVAVVQARAAEQTRAYGIASAALVAVAPPASLGATYWTLTVQEPGGPVDTTTHPSRQAALDTLRQRWLVHHDLPAGVEGEGLLRYVRARGWYAWVTEHVLEG